MKKFMSLILVAALALTLTPAITVGAAVPTLTVDMTAKTGAMRHGSGGFLYGLGSHGTPNANTLTPLKPGTAVQKAPDGLQHPTGDVLDVAETFIEAGGEQVQIYLQDIFALWSYEYTTIDDYLDRIREMVPKIVALRESRPDFDGKFVYVPYNEPDGIWFQNVNNDSAVQDRLNEYWKRAYALIKELDPKSLIGGISFATYQYNAMDKWLRFCAANDCEPDCITWHELQNNCLNDFPGHLSHYRSIEKELGMEPREIIINEYAPQDHCSVPGKLVNWIALFEENKVSGCLPYWHNAGNLDDIAADNNEPNGAWWLYKWYGDMSGETLSLTTSTARDQLYGLASIDDNKKSANVIFGGVDGATDIVLDNIADTEAFKGAEAVDIKVEATYWTAFHGVAEEPTVIRTGTYGVKDGKVTVELDGMEASAAYNITVTAATETDNIGTVYRGPWRKTWEAEKAELMGGAYSTSDPWTYAYSGGARVSGIKDSDDGVNFTVEVPYTGFYKADMIYGNGSGLNTAEPSKNDPVTVIQTRTIDGESEELALENTLRWHMAGMYTDYIELNSGEHFINLRGTGDGGADIDCLSLTYVGGQVPEFDSVYEAELGDFNTLLDNHSTTLTTESDKPGYSASGYVTGLDGVGVENGGGVRFTVVVPDNGMYNLTLRYAADADASANIYLDNTALTLTNYLTDVELPACDGFGSSSTAVFLQKGINIIDIDSNGAVALDYLRVHAADADAAAVVEAEDGNIVGGEAVDNIYASNGAYVAGLRGQELYVSYSPEKFNIVNISDGTVNYESTVKAQLIYADYDGKGLKSVKRVALPVGEKSAKLEAGHDKTFLWMDDSTLMPAASLLTEEQADADKLEFSVNVPETGDYKMVMCYSNNELFGAHDYNAQIVDRYASYSVNAGEPVRIYFKNTYSNDNWRTVAVPVHLEAGDNIVKFFNDNWRIVQCGVLKPGTSEHRPENIDYQTLVNYAPNIDSFSFYPAVLGASEAGERYKISVMSTDMGSVTYDKTSAAPGETVTLEIKHNFIGGRFTVTANGVDVTDRVEDGRLTMEIYENTDFRVAFNESENNDAYIYNNSFGSGDLTGWSAKNVSVQENGGVYEAVFSDGGSLSQNISAGPGYYTLSFSSRGAGKVSFGSVEADISEETVLTAVAADAGLNLSVTGEAGLVVDDFRITNFLPADAGLAYFVDCGDRNTATLSDGDKLGLRNSSTEQFFAADPVTGYHWGILDEPDPDLDTEEERIAYDEAHKNNGTYVSGLELIGKETWPYEYNSSDGLSKVISYRYAHDQVDHVGPGVTYKFELEDGRYDFEVGFYAPSPWLEWGNNRKSSLRVNDTVVASGILPTANSANPLVIRAQAQVTGGYATLNLNLDSDGNGGPMMSYIKIAPSRFKRINTSGMSVTGSATWNNDQNTRADKAFDGNMNTYFDGVQGGWAQIDFGERKNIAAIGYIPRTDWAARMNNTSFLVSNDGQTWKELIKVKSIPPYGEETLVTSEDFLTDTVEWRYLRYQNDNDYCNIAEIFVYEGL